MKTCYFVTYQELEGDNYAGGWSTRTTFVDELSELHRFSRVLAVRRAVVMTESDPLPLKVTLEEGMAAWRRLKMSREEQASRDRAVKLREEADRLEKRG